MKQRCRRTGGHDVDAGEPENGACRLAHVRQLHWRETSAGRASHRPDVEHDGQMGRQQGKLHVRIAARFYPAYHHDLQGTGNVRAEAAGQHGVQSTRDVTRQFWRVLRKTMAAIE